MTCCDHVHACAPGSACCCCLLTCLESTASSILGCLGVSLVAKDDTHQIGPRDVRHAAGTKVHANWCCSLLKGQCTKRTPRGWITPVGASLNHRRSCDVVTLATVMMGHSICGVDEPHMNFENQAVLRGHPKQRQRYQLKGPA